MAVFRNFKTGSKWLIQVHHENCTVPVSELTSRLNFESRAREVKREGGIRREESGKEALACVLPTPKAQNCTLGTENGRTIRKVMGGNPKKNHARENDGKIRAKKKVKKKNYAEGRSNCEFY